MKQFETVGKSKQLLDFLRNEIQNGEYQQGDKFPSIRDLASKYRLSVITVNSVISRMVTEGLLYVEQGRGTFVAEKALAVKKDKKLIGAMFFDFSLDNNVEAETFSSIQRNLEEDCFLIPYNSYNKTANFYKGLKGFMELEVDGMIVVPPTAEDYDTEVIQHILRRDVPVVSVNRRLPGIKADFIYVDFEKVAYEAVKYLINTGKKRIAIILHDSPSIASNMRKGFLKAHEDKGYAVTDERFILPYPVKLERLEAVLEVLLKEIDGLIAGDNLIYMCRSTINRSRKLIPEGLSIVGINDTVYSRFMRPQLTAMPYPSTLLGSESIRMLMELIYGTRDKNIDKALFGDIIIRES